MITPEQLASALRLLADNEVAFRFLVKPGQKKEGIGVDANGNVVVRVNAPAQEGKANTRVIEVLSEVFHCAKRDISLAKGQSSRHKEVRIKNTTLEELKAHFQQ